MYSGGGGDFVRFVNAGRTYTVFAEFGKGWSRSGVTIRKAGKLLKEIICKPTTPENWTPVYKAKLKEDPDRSQEP